MRNISPSKQATQYKGGVTYSSRTNQQNANQRPVSFAGEGGVGTSGGQIEDIYKRYCLNE